MANPMSKVKLNLPQNYLLYLIQFVQRLKGSEVVDVGVDDFVANLTENRVIELEEG